MFERRGFEHRGFERRGFERRSDTPTAPCDGFRVATYASAVTGAALGALDTMSPADDPYQRGYEDGARDAAATFDADRAHFSTLLAQADVLQAEPCDELAVLIAHSVAALVTTLTGQAPIDAAWLTAKAQEAAHLIADCDGARTLRLHPDDMALMDPSATRLTIMPDPAIARGSLRIDGSHGWIEHGRALLLDNLRDQLGMTS
jgi:flagellar assembly protein FliH